MQVDKIQEISQVVEEVQEEVEIIILHTTQQQQVILLQSVLHKDKMVETVLIVEVQQLIQEAEVVEPEKLVVQDWLHNQIQVTVEMVLI